GNGDGTFQNAQTYLLGGDDATGLVAANLGNGSIDLAAAVSSGSSFFGTPGFVSVLLGAGNGTFIPSTDANPQQATPLVGDINGDGTPDAVIVNEDGDILYRAGLAKQLGTFAPPVIVNPDDPAREAAILTTSQGDLIAALDINTKTVSLYRWNA